MASVPRLYPYQVANSKLSKMPQALTSAQNLNRPEASTDLEQSGGANPAETSRGTGELTVQNSNSNAHESELASQKAAEKAQS